MSHSSVAVLGVVVFLVGCSLSADPTRPSQDGVPSSTPSIVGTITSVHDHRIRVEANPAEAVGEKADVRIVAETELRDRNGGSIDESALAVGMQVRVWFSGPVAESFPVQATARVVVADSVP